MIKNSKSVRVLSVGVISLFALVGVGANFGLSARLFALPDSTRERPYERVLAAVREEAPNYWRTPSGPGLLISCADYRTNELLHALSAEYNQMYQCRVPGAEIASYRGEPNVGSATVDMFAGRAKIVVYVAHGDCKWNAAVRRRTDSDGGSGHFPQMVQAAPQVAESDMEQAIRHMQSLLTNPTLSHRTKCGEVEFVGLFLDADGAVYIWNPEGNKYDLIQRQ